MIAALFVQRGGVYFGLDDVDPWDESRDARRYAGPYPVVAGRARARDIITHHRGEGSQPRAAGLRTTPRGPVRCSLVVGRDESARAAEARVRAELDELERIAETVVQRWSACDGETPSSAEHWRNAGFCDAEVIEWLEAGVPWALSADALAVVGIEPRDVARQHEPGVTLGLAYARGEVSLATVQRLVLGEES